MLRLRAGDCETPAGRLHEMVFHGRRNGRHTV
jgi:hypothetical protein